ncbi:DUF7666 domain-containing protein [Subtercola endophyticus]|uniref:DUF7666 domain-containing protein n=1 Tax=Subtercola endophyticus TaxID=2895559 RepID=UPI001E619B7A|nr:hypothetical protein [Subtercola endophyticus]UFS59502.1 hypothetical protein LQ955_01490 [Subtercola endophyticus]
MTTEKTPSKTISAFKGFDQNLQCRGFQYVEGETYTQDQPAVLCGTGFHAVIQPIDVLRYYPPATSVYHQVEVAEVDGPRADDDSKVSGRVIKIGAKISLPALIKAQVEFVFANSKPVKGATTKAANGQAGTGEANGAATASGRYGAATASGDSGAATASGDYGAATASGDYGAATASGDSGAATASGDYGAATASGRYGAATASGDSGAATASGDYGAATASGDYGAATASGDSGAATASGDSGAATASGDYGAATASGRKTVAVVTGRGGRAKGTLGNWIVLTERDSDWNILDIQSRKVDGEAIKADTFYALRGRKVVEA